MRRNLRGVYKIVLLVMLFSLLQAAQAQERVVAYVPNWIDLPSFADTIDYSKVTHLNIAFENPTNDRGDLSFNRKNEALLTRAKTHRVPVLVSIGGGSASEDKTLLARYAALLTNASRGGFVAKVTEYVSSHDFAGVDLDIEGPSIKQDYGPFVAELARALRAKGKLLTAALSKGYGGNHVPDSVFEHFDFVNIMAYDDTGPWNPKAPGQHSSLEFAKDNVAYWLKRGLPKSKAVLGVPFYGYGFGAAFRKRDYPYAAIVAEFPGAENADEAGDTIYYNGLPTIRAKAAYVKEQRLGGVMIWSLDYDDKGDRSLLSAIHQTLRLNR